jgi:hypothetical protein
MLAITVADDRLACWSLGGVVRLNHWWYLGWL